MHARMSRLLLGTAAAGAAVAVAGVSPAVAAAAPGAAAPLRGRTGPVYTRDVAGYRTGFATGWRFRWVTTTFTVPSCTDAPYTYGWRDNGDEIGANSGKWQAELDVRCDAGAGAPVEYLMLSNGTPAGPVSLGLLPSAGDRVTMSVYYNRSTGRVRFTAADNTKLDAVVRSVHVGTAASYYGAQADSQYTVPVAAAPPVAVRTGSFSDSHVTAYSGRRGSLDGPWPTSQLIATTTGQADGDVIANAPSLWNSGRNFAAWERPTAAG